jgi:hypothetical protein
VTDKERAICQLMAEQWPVNVLRAMAAQDYPQISFDLLSGGKIYWSDAIALAEQRAARPTDGD